MIALFPKLDGEKWITLQQALWNSSYYIFYTLLAVEICPVAKRLHIPHRIYPTSSAS